MDKQDKELMVLAGLIGLGVWLWFSMSGKRAAAAAGSAVAAGASTIRERFSELTRGERNNNPGNIRKTGTAWQGKITGADSEFETFDSPENGIRALGKVALTYMRQYGLNTIRGIVTRYAPPSENNTAGYIARVSQSMGVPADTPLNLTDPQTLQSLATAMIEVENGRVIYPAQQIAIGIQRALA